MNGARKAMADKTTTTKKTKGVKRDSFPVVANFLNLNGLVLSLGDIRKAEFAGIEDPPASVKGLAAWAAQINAILRGGVKI